MRSKTEDALKMGIAGIGGFLVSYFLTNPTSKRSLKHKIPEKKIKNVQYLPNLKVYHKDKQYWIHHWASLTSLYAVLFAFRRKAAFKQKLFHAFVMGMIAQGLTYKDRFKFIQALSPENEPDSEKNL